MVQEDLHHQDCIHQHMVEKVMVAEVIVVVDLQDMVENIVVVVQDQVHMVLHHQDIVVNGDLI